MIQIITKKNEIMIHGHAEYAPRGQDIICAGVSALAQTLVASLEQLTEDKIEYEVEPGDINIRFNSRNLSESARLLIDSFFIGINLIADSYPEFVCVKSPKH